jgi:hypothetical protein
MKILYFLFISLLLYSCSQNTESESPEPKKEIEKDTLPRVEFQFPGEDLTFSIGEISSFDTTYYLYLINDSIPCKNKSYFIYTIKKNSTVEIYENKLTLSSDFMGIIIEYPHDKDSNCYMRGSTTEYGLWEETKHRQEVKSDFCFKEKMNHTMMVSKYDTLNKKQFSFHGINLDSTQMFVESIIPIENEELIHDYFASLKEFQFK